MIKVTLDFNCLIDIDENRDGASAIQEIIMLRKSEQLALVIPGIGASERKKGTDGVAAFFNEFKDRLAKHDIPNECISYPFARTDMTYADASYFAPDDPKHQILEWEVHQILHPEWQYNYQAHLQKKESSSATVDLKWRNRILDTLTMCCHLENKSDLFVSSDKNFFKETKMPKLIALGAGLIAKPIDALSLIQSGAISKVASPQLEYVKFEKGEAAHIPAAYEHFSEWYFKSKHQKTEG